MDNIVLNAVSKLLEEWNGSVFGTCYMSVPVHCRILATRINYNDWILDSYLGIGNIFSSIIQVHIQNRSQTILQTSHEPATTA